MKVKQKRLERLESVSVKQATMTNTGLARRIRAEADRCRNEQHLSQLVALLGEAASALEAAEPLSRSDMGKFLDAQRGSAEVVAAGRVPQPNCGMCFGTGYGNHDYDRSTTEPEKRCSCWSDARPYPEQVRAEFEAWLHTRCNDEWCEKNLRRGPYGNYTGDCTEAMWNAWQAARSNGGPSLTCPQPC